MSAEVLREAAALILTRAEAATAGRWLDFAAKPVDGPIYNGIGTERDPEVTICEIPRTPQGSMDAEHIAGMDPAVSALVANLLEACADAWPISDPHYATSLRAEAIGHRHALSIATAYLGSAS